MADRWFNFPLEMLTPERVRYRSAMAVELVPEDGTGTILDSYSASVIPF